jgi:hypothetical protein
MNRASTFTKWSCMSLEGVSRRGRSDKVVELETSGAVRECRWRGRGVKCAEGEVVLGSEHW